MVSPTKHNKVTRNHDPIEQYQLLQGGVRVILWGPPVGLFHCVHKRRDTLKLYSDQKIQLYHLEDELVNKPYKFPRY